MQADTIFQPLPVDQLEELVSTIDFVYQLVSVTLTNGDILMGGLVSHRESNDEDLTLRFNSEKGQRFGHSHMTIIPFNQIANIQPILMNEESTPQVAIDDRTLAVLKALNMTESIFASGKLPVHDYPNPLASVIANHNLKVITQHGMEIYEYVEKSLSSDAIPPEGIKLDSNLLLYTDWDFFLQQKPGPISFGSNIPFIGFSKDLSPSLEKEAFGRLSYTWLSDVRRKVDSNLMKDNIIQGFIFIPQPTDNTIIEGENCIFIICASSDEKSLGETYPVLLKLKCLRYPLEFLGFISSALTFYGEFLPIPLKVLDKTYKTTLLARAVGYIHEID